mgnify:CR=1 FL=1
MKPLIGITCNYDYRDEIGSVSHMGIAGQKWHFLADNYIDSIERAGGIPVMIPICRNMETVKEMVAGMAGILFCSAEAMISIRRNMGRTLKVTVEPSCRCGTARMWIWPDT